MSQPPPAPAHPRPGQGAPAASSKSGSGTKILLILGLGCGGVVLLGILLVVGLGFFAYKAVHDSGYDHELAKRNPQLAAAKMAVVSNPDLDLVSLDEDAGTLTIKDKKTGKVTTVNYRQIEQGEVVFETVDEEGNTSRAEVNVSQEGGKTGVLQVTTDEGQLTYGGEIVKPVWLPLYPGAQNKGLFSNTTPAGLQGSFVQESSDPPEKIAAHFEKALEEAGFTVKRTTVEQEGMKAISLNTDKDAAQRSAAVVVMQRPGQPVTTTVTFEDKK